MHTGAGTDRIINDSGTRDAAHDVFECGAGRDVVAYVRQQRDPRDVIRDSCERVVLTQYRTPARS